MYMFPIVLVAIRGYVGQFDYVLALKEILFYYYVFIIIIHLFINILVSFHILLYTSILYDLKNHCYQLLFSIITIYIYVWNQVCIAADIPNKLSEKMSMINFNHKRCVYFFHLCRRFICNKCTL